MKLKITLPEDVKYILEILKGFGHEAYCVGGCVRDSLLHKEPKDWDITTSAEPEEVKNRFFHTIPTGEKHGTITVMIQDRSYEVTTFRTDGDYEDGRRPSEVMFTKDIQTDLARRDFTINAMAYNEEKGLVDPFDGLDDLSNKIIKCVGSPSERLTEDYLRIIRAYRFALVYGFDIEQDTYDVCVDLLAQRKLSYISMERIQAELDKMLSVSIGIKQYHLFTEIFTEILNNVIDEKMRINKYSEDCFAFSLGRTKPHNRLAFLLHNYIPSEDLARKVLNDLKYPNKVVNHSMNLFIESTNFIYTTAGLKRKIRKYGFDFMQDLLQFHYQISFITEYPFPTQVRDISDQLQQIYLENQVVFLNQLQINGDDLMKELNLQPGKHIGIILEMIFEKVVDGKLNNSKEDIIKYIKNLS